MLAKVLVSDNLGAHHFNPAFRKAPKRIETLYSQLCGQFMIRRNYAKSFQGLATRILTKITALTVIQWFNTRRGLFDYIDVFYNRKRRHSHFGGISLEAFE